MQIIKDEMTNICLDFQRNGKSKARPICPAMIYKRPLLSSDSVTTYDKSLFTPPPRASCIFYLRYTTRLHPSIGDSFLYHQGDYEIPM